MFLKKEQQKCYNFIFGNMMLYGISWTFLIISYVLVTKTNVQIFNNLGNMRTITCIIWSFVGIDSCWNNDMYIKSVGIYQL